jgi:PAS domain S-box-containing protein
LHFSPPLLNSSIFKPELTLFKPKNQRQNVSVNTEPAKILLIDDQDTLRATYREFLSELGYVVFDANSGRSGLELASREQPDLILLDLYMPELDGLTTLNLLRETAPDIPVIVISGTDDIRDVVEALRHGASDYLTKPILSLDVLRHAVSNGVERARLLSLQQGYQQSLEQEVEKRTRELEEACRQLNASHATLDALFQAVPLAIIELDHQQRVKLWNRGAQQLFGLSADEIIGRPCPLLEQLDEKLRAKILHESLRNFELKFNDHRNERRILSLSNARSDEKMTAQVGLVLIFEDITEMIRLRKESDRASRLASLGQLSAGVAHEINNPNGLIMLNLQTLRDVLQDALDELTQLNPDVRIGGLPLSRACQLVPQLATEMEDSSRRIREIVEDLKDFAYRDPQEQSGNFDLNISIAKALRLAHNAIRKATDHFSQSLATNLPLIKGNPHRIEQVIVNLLINACQALPDRSAKLALTTCWNEPAGCVEIQVADEGCGISAENLPYITDPFFTTRREEGGTGLGLSVSARIVREHGGSLQFISDPGLGTITILQLPAGESKP